MFGLFSNSKKSERLKQHDYIQELERELANRDGFPYFGTRYEDDYRSEEEKMLSKLIAREKIKNRL